MSSALSSVSGSSSDRSGSVIDREREVFECGQAGNDGDAFRLPFELELLEAWEAPQDREIEHGPCVAEVETFQVVREMT